MPHPFYETPLATVTAIVGNGDRKHPGVHVTDDPLLYFFKLSKAGYGPVSEIKEWDCRTVIQALHYENFISDYENAYLELNKG